MLQSFFQGCYEQQEFDKELIQRLMMLIKALDQAANNNGRIRKQVDDEVERLETIITRIFNQKGMTDEDNVYELVTLTKSSETYKNPIVRRAASFYDPVIKTAIDLDITCKQRPTRSSLSLLWDGARPSLLPFSSTV